ncbi:MAG: class I SAM-dependent methyltransferase, partial [Acidimicrobiales bacterium]
MTDDHPGSYGDTFAEVYDAWYHDISDVAANVATVLEVAAGGRVLELGVGTGRIAIPLSLAGAHVVGIDASQAMLKLCRAKPGSEDVSLVCADMAETPVTGPFGV